MPEQMPKATFYGPLDIGDATIDAYVIEEGTGPTRLLSTRGVMKSIGRRWRGRKYTGTELPVFLEANNLKPFIDNDLTTLLKPVVFRTVHGAPSEGYKAEALPRICDVFLRAREVGALKQSQYNTAKQCEILVRGLATVGIIALVDEATGYQEIRDRYALNKILDRWIEKELQAWTKTFPNEFYEQMFRLKGWTYPVKVSKPQVVGRYTNEIVYSRLETGVLTELRRKNPVVDDHGHRAHRHHQWLTLDVGHPKLREHLAGVIALMRASAGWGNFMRLLNRSYPKKGDTLELPLDE